MDSASAPRGRINSTLRRFLDNQASAGIVLMAAAVLALVVANSPLAPFYFAALKTYLGPLSLLHWINDLLMALFFLMVGLEIKREMIDGQLSSWSRRILPGVAALGGMLGPAVIYAALNSGNPAALRGWAIPAATDIAFALGVLSLLGPRVPASLKVFLAALAIIDDLGAVLVIAVFYTADLQYHYLLASAVIVVALFVLHQRRVNTLVPYLLLGAALWYCVLRSGVHATLAGVMLAMFIPIKRTPASPEASPAESPLHRLEHALHLPVAFVIVPVFGFANAGVSFAGASLQIFGDTIVAGIALGLVLGKVVGILGTVWLLVRLNLADIPAAASKTQIFGVSLLCGIGFTMSLFIALLAFEDPSMQYRAKFGILSGSLVAGVLGYLVLRFAKREELRPAVPAN
ncbi:MAG TPA: Na+/H+ antiporter NhaA [Xanthobacteraceae bacterium]|nr:Na+/H+ antiporter NhaA [Xanthobacteraceae bacterium]